MLNQSLGLIEIRGLTAAVEAADAAVKAAEVELIGYELTRGGGWVTVKLRGGVSAVEAAVEAARSAAQRIGEVIAVKVIPRPAEGLELLIGGGRTAEAAPKAPEPGTPAGKKPVPAKKAPPKKETPKKTAPGKKEPGKKEPKKEAPGEKPPAFHPDVTAVKALTLPSAGETPPENG